ncbi:MAG: hypothetical protein EBS05_19655 [Proteobacteria bacterium]|nr:hypothetical protein [Pseudomonadota bacterium]
MLPRFAFLRSRSNDGFTGTFGAGVLPPPPPPPPAEPPPPPDEPPPETFGALGTEFGAEICWPFPPLPLPLPL